MYRQTEVSRGLLAIVLTGCATTAVASTVSPVDFDGLIRESDNEVVVVVNPRFSGQPLSSESDPGAVCRLVGLRSPRRESPIESRTIHGENSMVVDRSGRAANADVRTTRAIRAIECREQG